MNKKEKGLLSLLLIGVLGTVAGLGVFGAFSSTTSNPNNEFAAGTVAISDNDSNTAMYNVANQKPGDSVTRCIRVTYTGSPARERAPVHDQHDRGARPACQPDGHAGNDARRHRLPQLHGVHG